MNAAGKQPIRIGKMRRSVMCNHLTTDGNGDQTPQWCGVCLRRHRQDFESDRLVSDSALELTFFIRHRALTRFRLFLWDVTPDCAALHAAALRSGQYRRGGFA